MPVITLTTDFSLRDGFVGAMKGVILGINPSATIVDITHEIPPQDVPHAAFVLGTTCSFFPPQTIHLAVVDPGVGTSRHPLLLVTPDAFYVAPDNGVLTYVLMKHGATFDNSDADINAPVNVRVPDGCEAYVLTRKEYWLPAISNTFHGRDVFAPVAARLSLGAPPESLGEHINEIEVLSIPRPSIVGRVTQGHIIYLDRFGNLVSNIRLSSENRDKLQVEIQGRVICGLSSSYAEGDELIAIVGSHGCLEIAFKNGNAAQALKARVGTQMVVTTQC